MYDFDYIDIIYCNILRFHKKTNMNLLHQHVFCTMEINGIITESEIFTDLTLL